MGSLNQWYIDVNEHSANLVSQIIAYGREIDPDNSESWHWDEFAFRKWTRNPTHWIPEDFIKKISIKFPTVIFSMQFEGDLGNGKWFIWNGKELEENFVFARPKFPASVMLLEKKYKEYLKIEAAKTVREEKEALEKIAAMKQKKIFLLEKELIQLRAANQ